MKILVSFLLMMLLASRSFADTPKDQELSTQISGILKSWSQLQPGTTLLKIFTPDGGLSGLWKSERFIYRDCSSVKVDVDFTPADPKEKSPSPDDTIQKISKPYLEQPYLD